jgi:uncharacterized membrane protein YkoI
MKLNRIIVSLGVIALAAGCATEREGGKEADEAVTLSQVPAAVKETIKGYASEAEIKKIEKGDADGKIAYEFEITKNGKDSEVTIYPDGKLLGTEEIISLSEVPDAARNTINAQAAGGKLVSTEKVVENGKTVYEAIIEKGGKKAEVVVAPDGKVVGTEKVKAGKD